MPPAALHARLQTKTQPPIPALRLPLVVSLMAVAFLPLLDGLAAAGRTLRQWLAWHGQPRAAPKQQPQPQQPSAAPPDVEVGSSGQPSPAGSDCGKAGSKAGGKAEAASAAAAAAAAAVQEGREEHLQRPDVPGLRRGLSRKLAARLGSFEARHPAAHRALAALVIAVSMAVAGRCQLVAPGLVDAAIVQVGVTARAGGCALLCAAHAVMRRTLPGGLAPRRRESKTAAAACAAAAGEQLCGDSRGAGASPAAGPPPAAAGLALRRVHDRWMPGLACCALLCLPHCVAPWLRGTVLAVAAAAADTALPPAPLTSPLAQPTRRCRHG